MASHDSAVVLNYEEMKKMYFEYVHNSKILLNPLTTRQKIQDRIKFIQSTHSKQGHYVVEQDGVDKLFLPGVSSPREVVGYEDAFDIILNTHLKNNHADELDTYELLSKKYLFPPHCLGEVINLCCQSNLNIETKKRISDKAIWRLDILKYRKNATADDKPSYILFYKNDTTNFVVLRPLYTDVYESIDEVCMELYKIFLEFGPPEKILTHLDNITKHFIVKVISTIRSDFKIEVVSQSYPDFLRQKDKDELFLELENWQNPQNGMKWEIGCHIVQWRMNTTMTHIYSVVDKNNTRTGIPFELFFGKNANVFNYVYDPKSSNK